MNTMIYKILWTTIEDHVGLWEIYWELNSLCQSKNMRSNKDFLKKILYYFLETNLVRLYFNQWGSETLEELDLIQALEEKLNHVTRIQKEVLTKAMELDDPDEIAKILIKPENKDLIDEKT